MAAVPPRTGAHPAARRHMGAPMRRAVAALLLRLAKKAQFAKVRQRGVSFACKLETACFMGRGCGQQGRGAAEHSVLPREHIPPHRALGGDAAAAGGHSLPSCPLRMCWSSSVHQAAN